MLPPKMLAARSKPVPSDGGGATPITPQNGFQWHDHTRRILRRLAREIQPEHPVFGLREFFRQRSAGGHETLPGNRQSQVDGTDSDLQHVAGRGAPDVDWSVQRVIASSAFFNARIDVIQLRGNFFFRHSKPLEIARVSGRRFQLDDVAGVDREHPASAGVEEAAMDRAGGGFQLVNLRRALRKKARRAGR